MHMKMRQGLVTANERIQRTGFQGFMLDMRIQRADRSNDDGGSRAKEQMSLV
jgi:hypothetical protein